MTGPSQPSPSGGHVQRDVSGGTSPAGATQHSQALGQQAVDSTDALNSTMRDLLTMMRQNLHQEQLFSMAGNPTGAAAAGGMLRDVLARRRVVFRDQGAGGWGTYGQHREAAAQMLGNWIAGKSTVNYSPDEFNQPNPLPHMPGYTLPAPLRDQRVPTAGRTTPAPPSPQGRSDPGTVQEAPVGTGYEPGEGARGGGGRGEGPPSSTADAPLSGGDEGGGDRPSRRAPGDPDMGPSLYQGQRRAPLNARQRVLGTLGATVARSGGTASGMRQAIRDTIPYAAMAEDVHGMYGRVMDQVNVGQDWQRTIGGNRIEGYQEDLHSKWYQTAMHFTPFGSKRAAEAYAGVTGLGFTGMTESGGGRQQALDFIYHNYNSRGMNVQDSLQFLQQATQIGVTSFTQLSSAISDVSQTARQAGINAQSARQMFSGLMGAAGATGAGAGAVPLAQTIATNVESGGRYFAQAVNRQGMLSQGMQYMLGGINGMSPGQEYNMMRHDPSGYAKQLGNLQTITMRSFLSNDQIQWIKDAIARAGGGAALMRQKQLAYNIADAFMAAHQDIVPQTMMQFVSQMTGTQYSEPQAAAQDLVLIIAQQTVGTGADKTAGARTDLSGHVIDNNGKVTNSAAAVGKHGLLEATTSHEDSMGRLHTTGTGKAATLNAKSFGNNAVSSQYYKRTQSTKQRSKILESLMQNLQHTHSDMGTGARHDVVVHTQGGDRSVTWADAINNFPAEIESGQFTVTAGAFKGKNISDITTLTPMTDSNTTTQAANEMQDASLAKHGKEYKPKTSAQADNVKLTIGWADPNMASIFTTQQQHANASGSPVTVNNATAGSRVGTPGN